MRKCGVRNNRQRRKRISGIGEAATLLGVHRTHLYLVLTGQRQSHKLTARYRALKGGRK